MHVVLTVNSAWNIWNFRRSLVVALINDGHTVTVLSPPDSSVSKLERLGCHFRPLEMNVSGLNPVEDLLLLRQLRSSLKRTQPDVVFGFTIKNNIFGALAARNVGVPFVPNVTGLGTVFLSGGTLQFLVETLYRYAFKHLPVVFFQNEDDHAMFLRRGLVNANQARLLPGSGVDLMHFPATELPPCHAAPVFLMIARLLRDKGVLEYIEAARAVKVDTPQARFQLLGPVEARNRGAIDYATLHDWVSEGVVEYLGTTEDVRPIIAAASCVVLPSYREGAPRTLIEAAAMARPVVTTDVAGCRAVVDRDVSGLICEPRSAASLENALRQFLALPPGMARSMGLAGRAKMEREYDQARVVNAYREALGAALGCQVEPP